ncbi:MAG: nucleoside triphosphate pyrophosphohydrolase [Minisyncoccia bacterium]
MKYNKLVRDKIVDRIEAKGEKAVFHIADEPEYWMKLKEKLTEEVNEFLVDESLGELADIAEVFDAVMKYKRFTKEALIIEQQRKAEERGRFEKRIILDES